MTPIEVWSKIKVADLAKELGISRVAVYRWRQNARGIPPERALQVESVTGIDRQELRPDLWGSERDNV